MTKVSVCIAQYNRCEMLRLVISDLLDQTYRDFELLVCDDASTDATPQVVAEFSDPRIRYVRSERNLGLYPNFNRCIELAQGEYIAVYHNHDRYAAEIVERSVRLLDEHPEIGYVHTGTVSKAPGSRYDRNYVQNWPTVADGRWFTQHLIRRWDSPVHQPTVMARRAMYEKVGPYDDVTYGGCADSATWVQMSMEANVGYIPLPLMRVEPRKPTDRYGPFEWATVVGMARAHELGVRLLYDQGDPTELARQLSAMQWRHERYYLMLLAQWITKGRTDLVQSGLATIRAECRPWAARAAGVLVRTSGLVRPPLWLAAKSYGTTVRLIGRIQSERGWWISRRAARSA